MLQKLRVFSKNKICHTNSDVMKEKLDETNAQVVYNGGVEEEDMLSQS